MLDSSGECLGEMRRGENYQPTNTLICARDEAKRINGTYGVLYLLWWQDEVTWGGRGKLKLKMSEARKKSSTCCHVVMWLRVVSTCRYKSMHAHSKPSPVN
jgi:hypothetical protein